MARRPAGLSTLYAKHPEERSLDEALVNGSVFPLLQIDLQRDRRSSEEYPLELF